MSGVGISRRDILRTLALGATGGSVLQVIPAEAAEQVHRMVRKEKAVAPAAKYQPKYFTEKQYETLTALCDALIPRDERAGGAVEAGAPEFIDLLTSENQEYQARLGGGLQWLENYCFDVYGRSYLECSAEERQQTLAAIAYRKNAERKPKLKYGVVFFAFLRKMTCDGYYTSKIGIDDLQYIGNTAVSEFPGCPPLSSE